MTRLITAPAVGLLVGAIEGGVVFSVFTIIDVRQNRPMMFGSDEIVYLAAMIGVIFGGFVGAVAGLVVALRDARGSEGLLLGSLIGLALTIYLFATSGAQDELGKILALIVLPAGASMGLISAVLTASHKQRQTSVESPKSHRILS